MNNSLVLYSQVHGEPSLLSFREPEKNNFCPQKYGMSIVNREVIVEREGRGEKQMDKFEQMMKDVKLSLIHI